MGNSLQTHLCQKKMLSSAIYFMCGIVTFSEQTIMELVPKYNIIRLILYMY